MAPSEANAAVDTTLPGVAPTRRGAPPRPPKKAARAADCRTLEQLPNIGPVIAADLRSIGIAEPGDLRPATRWRYTAQRKARFGAV